jgi:hypothetical protein
MEQKRLWLQDNEFEILYNFIIQIKSMPPLYINQHYVRNVLKSLFDPSYLKKLTETHRKIILKGIFIAAIVRFLIMSMPDIYEITTRESFLEKYPEFEHVESRWELLALIRFERSLHVALQFLQGKGNKQLLLSIAAHLEGSNMQYVTGGQPSPGTKRRVMIFERLSGVRPVKRSKRDSSKLKEKAAGVGAGSVDGEDDYMNDDSTVSSSEDSPKANTRPAIKKHNAPSKKLNSTTSAGRTTVSPAAGQIPMTATTLSAMLTAANGSVLAQTLVNLPGKKGASPAIVGKTSASTAAALAAASAAGIVDYAALDLLSRIAAEQLEIEQVRKH